MDIKENAVGRPKEIKGRRRGVNVSVYMDDYLMEVLEDIHWRERKSVSELIRTAVEEYAKKHAEGNASFQLEQWIKNPDFIAVPTILATPDTWIRYVNECTNDELTEIGKQSGYIRGLVEMRRSKEFRERQSKT